MIHLFYFILYAVEYLIVFNYFSKVFEYKSSRKNAVLIGVAAYLAILVLYTFYSSSELLNIAAITVADYLIITFAYKSTQKAAIFHSITLSIIMYATEMITIYIISTVLGLSVYHYQENASLFIIDAIICKALYFFISNFVSLLASRETGERTNGKFWLLTFMPVSSIAASVLIHYLLSKTQVSEFAGVVCAVMTLFLLISNVVVFIVYEETLAANRKIFELQISKQKQELDMSYLELLEQKNKTSQQLMHDIKNHLTSISSIANSKEIDEYIKGVYGSVLKYSFVGKTGNRMLDLVLNKYSTVCDTKGITFKVEFFSENLSFMNEFDISTLLNNMLDNAVESCEKCKAKSIYLSFSCNENKNHIVNLRNSCETQPNHRGTKLITSKPDSAAHGIGTESIKSVAFKYNGDVEWDYDSDKSEFSQIIVFPAQ